MQLNLTGRSVLVLDGSAPAAVTVSALLHERALVTVAAPAVCAALEDLALRGRLTWVTTPVDETGSTSCCVPSHPRRPGRRQRSERPDASRWSAPARAIRAGHRRRTRGRQAGRRDPHRPARPVEALKWARPDAEIIDVTKIPYGRSTSQEQINALLVEHARAGRHVVRFKGGDSYVFGRGFEEVTACAEAGVPTTVIPGVTSSIAAPELAGIPVTHRGLVQGFTVISGHVPPGHPDSSIDYAALARTGTTLVVLMGMRNLAAIADALVAAGLDRNTPCAVVADAASAGQRVLRSTLADVVADTAEAGIGAPAVTVIGHVVALGPAAVQAVATASRCSDT
ncbi:uroporphyrinogen-III C-methyltransferase [Micromonospora sp. BRA006-A]|nr:uroporphyrinogen-III C-methyltransferase [Micromonospora sp. BRA006-A]